MKQKLILILGLMLMAIMLIGLNALSYRQKPKEMDSEAAPNRSSFNTGTTGTQAYFTLLTETGRKAVRWQEPPDALSQGSRSTLRTFVIIGPLRRPFTEPETSKLLDWVSHGGRLVVIDREPEAAFVTTSANWDLKLQQQEVSVSDVFASGSEPSAVKAPIADPVQPSPYSAGVGNVQPSKLASSIEFSRKPIADGAPEGGFVGPLIHFRSGDKNIVVDVPFGSGRIVFLTDPFVVSNGGIASADNAQLAVNLASNGDGIVAFDEFHQGFGSNNNRLAQFFAGTPVVAIFFQLAALAGLVFYSRSRRFARPLPDAEPDRLSKLEYVGAMAELQQRTRAYDLAVENIYREFRRRASRVLGVDNRTTDRTVLSKLVAERIGLDVNAVDTVLYQCEEIMHGEPASRARVADSIRALRKIEQALGLGRRGVK